MPWAVAEGHGHTWRQFERGGFWESDAGYVEGVLGKWYAYPHINADRRLAVRGPYHSRSEAMRVTAEAFGTPSPQ